MRTCLIFAICSVVLWRPCRPQYVLLHLDTYWKMTRKMQLIAGELVKDAEMKIEAVQFYRDQYYKSLAYQLGEMVYQMRYKFKRMVFLFQQAEKDLSYNYRRHTRNVQDLIRIYQKGIEIDNVARMVEQFEFDRENIAAFHKRMNRVVLGELVLDRGPRLVWPRTRLQQGPPLKPGLRLPAGKHKRMNQKWRRVVKNDFI